MADRSEHGAETVILTEPEGVESGNVHSLLRQYVQETRQHLDTMTCPAPTPGVRRMYLVLAIVGVLALGGFGLGVLALLQHNSAAQSAERSLALYERELCSHRQEAVMRAITQYIHDHNEAPKDLSVLKPPYLTVPPVDPVSGVPYRYVHEGNSVYLTCAKHPLSPQVTPR
jgi:hypothetical protein